VDQHHRELFLTKLADWEAEREYRYVVLTDWRDDYAFVPYGDALQAVFLGQRYPASEESLARSAVDAHGLALYRLLWTNSRPGRATVG
jgi:hypothetical protein